MKKMLLIVGISIIAIVVGFIMEKYFLSSNKNNVIIAENKIINKTVGNYYNSIKNEEIETSIQEKKISVKTVISQVIYYKECNHEIKYKIKNIDKYINMTKEDFKKEFPNWEIKEFNCENVILYKEEDDFCNEHFLVIDDDGYVAIYTIDNSEKVLELLDKTDIATNYLTRNRSREFKKRHGSVYKRKFK